MKRLTLRYAPVVAAALMASLTIRVFFELQNFGPESAIRRFNEAVKANDDQALQKVTADPMIGEKVHRMITKLTEWDAKGASLQVGRIEQSGNEVRAAVVFTFPNGTITGTVWVVEKRGRLWLVDANKTATILSDNLG